MTVHTHNMFGFGIPAGSHLPWAASMGRADRTQLQLHGMCLTAQAMFIVLAVSSDLQHVQRSALMLTMLSPTIVVLLE